MTRAAPRHTLPVLSTAAGQNRRATGIVSRARVTRISAPPTTQISPAQRDAAIQDVRAKLLKLQETEPERRMDAAARTRASAAYQQAAKQLADAESYRQTLGDSGSREERSKATLAISDANTHLVDIIQASIASDAQVIAAHSRISELRAQLDGLESTDLLDTLGDDPNTHAVAGNWEFKGNSLRVAAFSKVVARLTVAPAPGVYEPGRTDERGNPLVWDRATLHFPVDVPQEYVLTMHLRRLSGGATTGPDVMIPVRGGTLVCELDSTRQYDRRSRLWGDPQEAEKMAAVSSSGAGSLIRGAGVHEVIISVVQGGQRVSVAVDGRLAREWRRDLRGVFYPVDLEGQMPPPRRIGISVTNAPIELVDLTLRGITAGPTVAAQPTDPAVDAENDLGKKLLAGDAGNGVAPDYEGALKHFRNAVAAGSRKALNNIGMMYLRGEGGPLDPQEATWWFRMAADAGEPVAMNNLGIMYLNGQGVAQDYAEAMTWFGKAAEAGNVGAMNQLGAMYYVGKGVAQDYVEAMKWALKAAEAGDLVATLQLGIMYLNGQGVARDYAEALKWFYKGAEAGDSGAMSEIGSMYASGEAVAKDEVEAADWYRKAADAGNAVAMRNLGSMYENGQGVTQDHAEAINWYRKAAAAGNEAAKKELIRMGIRRAM